MDLLGALGVLIRVVETGSFSAVARERGISQAAVARQISQLEERFGVRLFHRTTRKLSLTNDGEILICHARPLLESVEGIESTLGRQSSSPVGLVRVGLSVAGSHFLTPRLPILVARHPGLKIELIVSDRLTDMIEERLDLAMRVGEITDVSLVKRSAGVSPPRIAVAAPAYVERHGAPSEPSELANHRCLVHDTGPDANLWTFAAPEGLQSIRVSRGFLANDSGAIYLATVAGHGIALLPQVQVLDGLRSGQLVHILPDCPAPGAPVSLVYSSRRHLAPRTRLVMEFILQQIHDVREEMAAAGALLTVEHEMSSIAG